MFINNTDEVSHDREIPQIKKPLLSKNRLIVGLVLLGIGFLYYRHSGDDSDVRRQDDVEESRIHPKPVVIDWGPVQVPVKTEPVQVVEPIKTQPHAQARVPPKPVIYQKFSNRFNNQNTSLSNQDTPYIDNAPLTGSNFDKGEYIKNALSGLMGTEPKPPTLNDRLNVQRIEKSYALRQTALDKKILQGKIINAVIDSSIQSDLPGMIRAVIQRDIYSENGQRVILPGGSMVIGRYAGGLEFGINRLFVIWERIKTMDGVDITINSPGTDGLGRSGMAMFIDAHFWERFGSSVLLSVINAGVSIAGGVAADGNQNTIQQIQQNFNQSAQIALEKSLNIKPTGYAHHGESIVIFVARDLDFTHILR